MRKQRRLTYKQLVLENKQNLYKNKAEMEKIDKKIEEKQLNKSL